MQATREFSLNGVSLRVPGDCLNDALIKALETGRYEHTEAAALERHLQAGDRVLDLGAGVGYLTCLAARIVGGRNITAVEANPDIFGSARANLDANGAGDATLIHGAVVADDLPHPTVRFHRNAAFWAAAVAADDVAVGNRICDVPALKLSDLFAQSRADVVILDVEGAEAQLTRQRWPAHVRLLVMEIHTRLYPARTLKGIFDGLSASGMTYMPWGSRGETLVFQRVE